MPLVVGYRRIRITVELHYGIDELPYFLIGGMKDMGTIFMDVDVFHQLTIDIAAQVGTLVDDQAPLVMPASHAGKGGSEQAGTDNQIVIRFHGCIYECFFSVSQT